MEPHRVALQTHSHWEILSLRRISWTKVQLIDEWNSNWKSLIVGQILTIFQKLVPL